MKNWLSFNRVRLSCVLLIALTGTACTTGPQFPDELKLRRVLFKAEEVASFGPGGLSQSLTVYELPQRVSKTLAAQGLPYLQTLPSVIEQTQRSKPPRIETYSYQDSRGNTITKTAKGPYWAPFATWNNTPIPNDPNWLRRDARQSWQPTLKNFFGAGANAKKLISTLPPELVQEFETVIATPGSYYSFGYYRDVCLLVVSPGTGKAFYLFRD